jgi:hypothetical protein
MVAEVLIVNGDALGCAIGRIPEAGSEDPAPQQVNSPVATRTPSRRFRNPEPRFPKLRAPNPDSRNSELRAPIPELRAPSPDSRNSEPRTPNPGTNELPGYRTTEPPAAPAEQLPSPEPRAPNNAHSSRSPSGSDSPNTRVASARLEAMTSVIGARTSANPADARRSIVRSRAESEMSRAGSSVRAPI